MKTIRKTLVLIVAGAATLGTLAATMPAATAGETPAAVASARSFPKANVARRDFLQESTSTQVEDDSNWGGVETLNVPKTKSQAEKDAEARAAAEEAARQQAAEEAARQRRAAASRSAARESLSSSSVSSAPIAAPNAANAAGVIGFAQQFVGNWTYGGCAPASRKGDCSCFTQYVFSQIGVSLPRTSGGQMGVGTRVPSLAQAQPGDLIANASHVGIYLGNGVYISSLNPRVGVKVLSVNTAPFTGGNYVIRRVL